MWSTCALDTFWTARAFAHLLNFCGSDRCCNLLTLAHTPQSSVSSAHFHRPQSHPYTTTIRCHFSLLQIPSSLLPLHYVIILQRPTTILPASIYHAIQSRFGLPRAVVPHSHTVGSLEPALPLSQACLQRNATSTPHTFRPRINQISLCSPTWFWVFQYPHFLHWANFVSSNASIATQSWLRALFEGIAWNFSLSTL